MWNKMILAGVIKIFRKCITLLFLLHQECALGNNNIVANLAKGQELFPITLGLSSSWSSICTLLSILTFFSKKKHCPVSTRTVVPYYIFILQLHFPFIQIPIKIEIYSNCQNCKHLFG
jgi:hypothetical protein